MSADVTTVFLTFPPRSIGDGEREIVKLWFAGTTDISAAYASERRGDDPAYYRRVVIIETGSRSPSYLLHCPEGADVWLLTDLKQEGAVTLFPSLRAALHAVRPMPGVADPAARPVAGRAPVSAAPAGKVAEMAAGSRRLPAADNAAATPRRKPT